MKQTLSIFVLALPVLAQQFQVSSPQNAVVSDGASVQLTYEVPADNALFKAGKTNPAMAPNKVIWLWGDEDANQKTRNFTEVPYDSAAARQICVHHYKKPGVYTVAVVVNDQKNRNIVEDVLTVKVSFPVEVVDPHTSAEAPAK